jgi:menaquinone-dependent protoporphyrinogen IX oxidase
LIKDWLKKNENALQDKKIFLFIVCGTHSDEKEKLGKLVIDNIPESLIKNNKTFFLRGKVRRNLLSWSDRLLLKISALLTPNPNDKRKMREDYDEVKKENLLPMLNAVNLTSPRVKAKSATT